MSQRLKNIIAVSCLLVLCLHFILVVNYTHCFSQNTGSKLDQASAFYTYPFFHQGWQMFVPAPKTNYHLYVRSCKKGSWSDWEDLFTSKILNHQANRLSGNEFIALLYGSVIAHSYHRAIYRIPEIQPADINFKILNHAIKNDLRFYQRRDFDTYEIMISATENNSSGFPDYYTNLH